MPASPELQEALDRLGHAVTIRATGGGQLRRGAEGTETFWRPGMRRAQTNIIRTEGDERTCLTCRRRWGLNEERPNCARGCNGRA